MLLFFRGVFSKLEGYPDGYPHKFEKENNQPFKSILSAEELFKGDVHVDDTAWNDMYYTEDVQKISIIMDLNKYFGRTKITKP